MQGKSLYAILLSIIAVLALALAVLVIFLFTTYNNMKTGNAAASATPTSQEAREVPPDEEGQFILYSTGEGTSADAIFNLKTSPAHDGSFLMATITIFYDAGSKKAKNPEDRSLIFQNYKSELKQACIAYFLGLTYEDISEDSAMEKASDTLKDSFNSILEGKDKDKIVLRIVFDKWIKQ